MKPVRPVVASCIALTGGLLSITCAPTNRCSATADEVREILDACDVDTPDYAEFSDEECTEPRSVLAECVLTCYRQTPCQELLQGAVTDCIATKCY